MDALGPLAGGLGYPVETLMKLVDAVPSVRAIKDWCNNPVQHERHVRLLQSLPSWARFWPPSPDSGAPVLRLARA